MDSKKKKYTAKTMLYLALLSLSLTAGLPPIGCGTMCCMVATAPVWKTREAISASQTLKANTKRLNNYADKNNDGIINREELEAFLTEAGCAEDKIASIPSHEMYAIKPQSSRKKNKPVYISGKLMYVRVYDLLNDYSKINGILQNIQKEERRDRDQKNEKNQ